ncbi:MAG: hypothetical protein WKF58_02775 [Ilumatobacteraceae bacterium]
MALTVAGLLLLLNIVNAAFTLALLVGAALMLEEASMSWPSGAPRDPLAQPLCSGRSGSAPAWLRRRGPAITLWVLAAVAGIGFICIGGVAQMVFARRDRRLLPGWALWLVAGTLSVVVEIACLVWPERTILVLGVLLRGCGW